MKAYYKNDLKRAYLILEGAEDEEADYQTYMLAENDISGLLKTDIRYIDNRMQYYYDISGKVSLKAIHEKVKLSYKEMKELTESLLQTIKTIRKYMLDGDCLLLEPEYIFCEKEKFFFCYYPQCGTELKTGFHKLTEYFVSEVDYQEQDGVHFAYRMHKETMEENYSIEWIMRELTQEREGEKQKAEVRYDEKMEEVSPENQMIAEKKELWQPVKRLLDRKKHGRWGKWDEIYIEEENL